MSNLLVAVLAAIPLGFGELIVRLTGLKKEFARKIVHVLGGIVAALLLLVASRSGIGEVVVWYALVMLVVRTCFANQIRSLYDVSRSSYGEITFPIGVAVAALLAPDNTHYVGAMLVLGFSDTVAALVGPKYPFRSWNIWGGKKSLGGSTAFLISATALLLLCGYGLGIAAGVAFVATIVEAVSPQGIDNMLVPIVVALL